MKYTTVKISEIRNIQQCAWMLDTGLKKIKKEKSNKRAASLTMDLGQCRMNL